MKNSAEIIKPLQDLYNSIDQEKLFLIGIAFTMGYLAGKISSDQTLQPSSLLSKNTWLQYAMKLPMVGPKIKNEIEKKLHPYIGMHMDACPR